MSVINKMLRDLDSRQRAAGVVPASAPPSRSEIARDTLIVNPVESASRSSVWLAPVLAALAVLVVAAAAAWWYLNQYVLAPSRATPVSTPVPMLAASGVAAPLPEVAVPVPAASMPVAPVLANQLGVIPADMSLRMDSNLKLVQNSETASKTKPVVPPQPVAAPKAVKERPSSAKAVKPVANVSATATPVLPDPPRQSPVHEALAQAQSLWSSGSHQAAIDLLSEALTTSERANTASARTGNKSVLVALARRLSSMQMAEGRVSQTLELLTRLETDLSGEADIWAIRGNAAQRLGRHAESVVAYQMALKIRPNEPRWMLGAAVSLAAQGQTTAAAELAKKARAGGALSPEVATYLRQLGVPL